MTVAALFTMVSGLAAAGAAGTALRAAMLWLRASVAQPHPDWTFKHPEPGTTELRQLYWTVAMLKAGQDGGVLNARAARWTSVALVFAAAQSVAGFLSTALT